MNSILYNKVFSGDRISIEDARALYRSPLTGLGALADARRRMKKKGAYGGCGDKIVTYLVDRNINYTNVCCVHCRFCAFYRTEKDEDGYVLTPEQVSEKIRELEAIGGTQVLLQGGNHPTLGLDYYLGLLHYIREKHPGINVHGFSPPEFQHFTKIFNMPLREVIVRFKEAGLGSIPGGGAEILVDRVRGVVSPRKCTADEWLDVMRVAHQEGLRTSATMMFGHVETVEERIEHLRRLRDLQDETGGFTAFICWTFQPQNTALQGDPVGAHEYLRMQALSRIFLDNFDNVQASWVTQGPRIGQIALQFGANDFGSIMMEENVVSSAGAKIFQMTVEEMHRLISEMGFEPKQRNNAYQILK